MKQLLYRLDSADAKTFSTLKWSLSAFSAGATLALVTALETV